MEAILWKPFKFFLRILKYVSNITRTPYNQCWLLSKEKVKISWCVARRVWVTTTVIAFLFTKKSLTKTDRCTRPFSWRRNQSLILHFSGRFFLTASLSWRRILILIFVVPCIMLNSEIIPTRCNNCVYSSQWLYSQQQLL